MSARLTTTGGVPAATGILKKLPTGAFTRMSKSGTSCQYFRCGCSCLKFSADELPAIRACQEVRIIRLRFA